MFPKRFTANNEAMPCNDVKMNALNVCPERTIEPVIITAATDNVIIIPALSPTPYSQSSRILQNLQAAQRLAGFFF